METASRMPNMPSREDMARLRSLVPLHTLPDDALSELLADAGFEKLRKGKMLFEQGATDHENVYLLEGRVGLLSNNAEVDVVTAGSDTARFPLAHQLPRKQGARAKSTVRIVRVDSRRLSELLARTQTVDYQVDDLEDATEDDWMSMLLQSRVLQQVPASNIQRVMMRVEQVEVSKGDDLIRQGDPGDYYYMLTHGRAVVRRDSGDGKGPTELATLGPGDAFGEEALLSDNPRNSTITMLHDGLVLRLSKEDFLDLIHNPLLDRVDREAAQRKIAQGAVWLDLRSSEQYDESHLPGAINFPFESLRYQASSLAPDRHYVLYSNTGGRAMAGAFLLTERGFDVSVLDGGVRDEAIADVANAENPAAAVPQTGAVDDEIIQQRVREAEARAAALQQRLDDAQRDQESVNAERQHHLQQVRVAVDQARKKLIETEQQKREALAEREKAYADMERLTGNLEAIESERESLRDRMSEIEGLDKQLQTRLAKAERELIGERERAESAASSLDELGTKLNDLAEKREHEREQYAVERGELTEQLTALQLDLEQANADLAAANDQLSAQQAEQGGALDEARERLASLEADDLELQRERADLQQQLATAAAQEDVSRSEVAALQERLAEQQQAVTAATQDWQSRIEELNNERDGLREKVDALESQATETADDTKTRVAALQEELATEQAKQANTEAEREELRQAFDKAREQHDQTAEGLQDKIDQLRADNETLQKQLAAGSEEAGEAIEQAQARASALDAELQNITQQGKQALAAALTAQTELQDALTAAEQEQAEAVEAFEARLKASEADRAQLAQQLSNVESARLGEADEAEKKHQTEVAKRAEAEQTLGQLHAQLNQAEADRQTLQAQLAEQQGDYEGKLQLVADEQHSVSVSRDEAQAAVQALEQKLQEAEQAATAAVDQNAALQRQHDSLAAQLEAADQGAEAVVAELRQQLAEVEAARDALQSKLEQLEQQLDSQETQQAERLQTAEAEQQALKDELATLQGDHEKQREQGATDAQQSAAQRDELEATLRDLQQRLDEAERTATASGEENETLRAQLDGSGQDTDEAVAQLRSEKQELANQLEEKQQSLKAAREEQGELIEALNAASAERETLQFALSERDDEQARLVDLENQVAEAIRNHERELLNHEEAQREWHAQIDEERAARLVLEAQLADSQPHSESAEQKILAERDALLTDLAVRDSEVEQLRGVIEEYVDQIRAAQSGDGGGSEIAALRAELAMVRDQAVQDVAHMREQLAAVETQKRRLQEADGREAISLESMRQRIEELESSLGERQRDLASADEARHMLEDQLEDANGSLDDLRRELQQAQADADEALMTRREAETARDQLQTALASLQDDVESVRGADLRDDRLAGNQRPISLDSGGNRWMAGLLGALLVLGGLEATSFLTGNGELFSALLRLSGQ